MDIVVSDTCSVSLLCRWVAKLKRIERRLKPHSKKVFVLVTVLISALFASEESNAVWLMMLTDYLRTSKLHIVTYCPGFIDSDIAYNLFHSAREGHRMLGFDAQVGDHQGETRSAQEAIDLGYADDIGVPRLGAGFTTLSVSYGYGAVGGSGGSGGIAYRETMEHRANITTTTTPAPTPESVDDDDHNDDHTGPEETETTTPKSVDNDEDDDHTGDRSGPEETSETWEDLAN